MYYDFEPFGNGKTRGRFYCPKVGVPSLFYTIQSTSTPIANSQEGTITYQYNSFGEPITIADNDETKEITYSNFGEVIKEVTGLQTNSYQYDEDGNLLKHIITDKDLEDYVTEYSYNKSGLVTAITTGMGTETITYDKAGRIKEKANDLTGYSKSYSYYKDNTIRDIKTRMDGNLVYYENFGYDKNGNKIYDDQNGDIKKYTYDGLNRLTGAEIGNVRTEYEFDNFNNISREYEIIGGRIEKKTYYYDNANRLLLEDSENRTVQYEYDNSGNLTKKITGIGANAETAYYRYDGYNRLSEFIDDYSTAEYSYNINGLRESKTVNGTKTRYIYNGADIVGEIFDDNIYTHYRATELIGYTNNKGDRYYYRQNSHGDVTALLTVDGQEKKTYSYNAYGKETPFSLAPMGNQTVVQLWKAETEQVYNPFRYCGEYQDAETGLIYLRNRYYDNSIGRFTSEDPIKDGLNWYVYCSNNPVMFVDPNGTYYIKNNGDGTYIAKPDTYWSVIWKAGACILSEQMADKIENVLGHVGGNFNINFDSFAYVSNKQIEQIHPYYKALFELEKYANAAKMVFEGDKIVQMDKIAFDLLPHSGVPSTFENANDVDEVMKYTYGFIESYNYFDSSMGTGIFRGETLYKIDYELSQSKDPQRDINKYYERARTYYIGLGYKNSVATGMANVVKGNLEKYNERRAAIFDLYSQYMSECVK